MTSRPRFVGKIGDMQVAVELVLEGSPDGLSVRAGVTRFHKEPRVRVCQDPPANESKITEAQRALALGLAVNNVPEPVFSMGNLLDEFDEEEFASIAEDVLGQLVEMGEAGLPDGVWWKKEGAIFPVLVAGGARGKRFEAEFVEGASNHGLDGLMEDMPELFASLEPSLQGQLHLLVQLDELRRATGLRRLEAEKASATRKERAALAAKLGVPNPDEAT
ncbi:MAG TPA: hypothetical protein VJG48_01375 [Candidatus Paceibacterota bacterium]